MILSFLIPEGEHKHDSTVSSCSCKFEGELNVNKLKAWISELTLTKGKDLFRYKGVIAVKGMDRKFVFQGVHMLFRGDFAKNLAPWKSDEIRECRFVFIGRNLDKDNLIQRFMACKATKTLRFKVGDVVEARCGGKWQRGVITQHWDEAYPYVIKLLVDGQEVLGPEESD